MVRKSRECTLEAIKKISAGAKLNEIGASIHEYCIQNGVTSVCEFHGHGIGTEFHELPYIHHYRYEVEDANPTPVMREGMVFTVEPMLC